MTETSNDINTEDESTFVFSTKLLRPAFTTSRSGLVRTYLVNGVEFYDFEWDGLGDGAIFTFAVLNNVPGVSNEYPLLTRTNMGEVELDDVLQISLESAPGGVVINNYIFLSDTQWNCLVYYDEANSKCVMCTVVIKNSRISHHIESVIHKTNLNVFKPLRSYGLTITRKIRDRYHCGVCNLYIDLTKEGDHYATDLHRSNLLCAITKISNNYYHDFGQNAIVYPPEEVFEFDSSDDETMVIRMVMEDCSPTRNFNNNIVLKESSAGPSSDAHSLGAAYPDATTPVTVPITTLITTTVSTPVTTFVTTLIATSVTTSITKLVTTPVTTPITRPIITSVTTPVTITVTTAITTPVTATVTTPVTAPVTVQSTSNLTAQQDSISVPSAQLPIICIRNSNTGSSPNISAGIYNVPINKDGPPTKQQVTDHFADNPEISKNIRMTGPFVIPHDKATSKFVAHVSPGDAVIDNSLMQVGVLLIEGNKAELKNVRKLSEEETELFHIAREYCSKSSEEKRNVELKNYKNIIGSTANKTKRKTNRGNNDDVLDERDAIILRELYAALPVTAEEESNVNSKNKKEAKKESKVNKKATVLKVAPKENTEVNEVALMKTNDNTDNFKTYTIKLNFIALSKLHGTSLKLFKQSNKMELKQLKELYMDENAKFFEIFDEEDHVYMKLKEVHYRITNSAYNSFVQYGRSSKYCVVCSEQIEVCNLKKHEYKRAHKLKLNETYYVESYSEHLIRQVDTIAHCAVCNVIVWPNEITDHLQWPPHLLILKLIQQSEKKVRKYETKLGVKVLTVVTKVEDKIGTESVVPKPIDARTLTDVKFVRIDDTYLKLGYENWNGILKLKKTYKCQLCSVSFDSNLIDHLCDENHLSNTQNSFMLRYAPALIRQIDSNQVQCVTCNAEIQNREKMILLHKNGKKHVRMYEALRMNTDKHGVPIDYFHIM